MPDPNATYKSQFAALIVKLGRTPTCKDKEWVTIGEELRKAWMNEPASDTMTETHEKCYRYGCTNKPIGTSNGDPVCYWHESKEEYLARTGSAAGSNREGFSRQLAPQASAIGVIAINTREAGDGEATGRPGVNETGVGDRTTPEAPRAAPLICEGDRGPGGGLMCRCEVCGVLWERERKRGRPAYRCPGCRQ